jgi:Uma2 family endonuclease
MPATLEQNHSAVFTGVTWDFYWTTREEVDEGRQVIFDGERMEIMASPVSIQHDNDKKLIARLVELYAFLKNVPLRGAGSPTLASEAANRGCEADEAYFLEADDEEVDPPTDAGVWDAKIHRPPDLIVEIDLTSHSVSKEPVYAALGVRELWRWERGDLTIRELAGDAYRTVVSSRVLPHLPVDRLAEHVRLSRRLPQHEVLQHWQQTLA